MNNNTDITGVRVDVTVNKQRLEGYITGLNYNGSIITGSVPMEDKTEFEIEMKNTLSQEVLAQISINGESIGGGVVLRPGEHVFLERYLDKNKKFLFETYEVDGSDIEVAKAIKDNGLVQVDFFVRKKPEVKIRKSVDNLLNKTNFGEMRPTCMSYADTPISYNTTLDWLVQDMERTITGRIGEGGESDQGFTKVNYEFEKTAFKTFKWKLEPKSNIGKLEASTNNNILGFCGECGEQKSKVSHRFCTKCGSEY